MNINYDDILTDTTMAAENAGFEVGTKEYAEIVSALITATAIETAGNTIASNLNGLSRAMETISSTIRFK